MSPSAVPVAGSITCMPCPAGHPLLEKQVAGTSWFAACKSCSLCRVELKAGMARHSCKACKYHLCASCYGTALERWLKEDITITVYRAAQPGVEEDAWQVSVQRGATIGTLRAHIATLYGLPPHMQMIRRDVECDVLADNVPIGCDEGDVLHLSIAPLGSSMMGPLSMMSPLGIPPITELADALSGAMNEVAELGQAMQKSLENTTYNLTFVLPERAPAAERRCRLEIAAVAHVQEVLDMVKFELDVEDVAKGLEFAGQDLPLHAQIHMLGLRDGDTVMVIQHEASTSL